MRPRVSVVVVMIAGLIFLTCLKITLFVTAATTAKAAAVVAVGAADHKTEELVAVGAAAVVEGECVVAVKIAGLIFLPGQKITLCV